MAFLGSIIAKAERRHYSEQSVRSERTSVQISAMVSRPGLPLLPVVAHNFSAHGLGLSACGDAPEQGEEVMIRFANGVSLAARVAWVDGTNFGVRLEERLDVARLGQPLADRRRKPMPVGAMARANSFLAGGQEPAGYRACYL